MESSQDHGFGIKRLEIAAIKVTFMARIPAWSLQLSFERKGTFMRGVLVGFLVFAGLLAAGFGTLVVIANGIEPSQEEVRVQLDDDFPR